MAISGGSGGGRTTMNEINVTPLVDVMLVLLIIFMVTAPLIQHGVKVDLPKTKAAPVGNALFATAAGLFAAIPAVVAYNSFVSRIRVFDTEMSNFSSDFLNIIKRHFFK